MDVILITRGDFINFLNMQIDTHALVKRLMAKNFTEEQAEEMANTIVEIESNTNKVIDNKFESTKNELATKEFVRAEINSAIVKITGIMFIMLSLFKILDKFL